MPRATKKEIREQIDYIKVLTKRLDKAVDIYKEEWQSHSSGTINNLAPELSKAASQLKQMMNCNWS